MSVHRIVTHPGSAHKDDFLACSVLVHLYGAPIFRCEPTAEDLSDVATAVVDVGGEHEPTRSNYDHHQFPRDHEPACALTLVLKDIGIYEDARNFCEWMETAEWFDSRGPVATARWLGVDRGVLNQLNSPIDITLLRRFAQADQLSPGEPMWEIMRMVGEDIVEYLKTLRSRLEFIGQAAEEWNVTTGQGGGPFLALYLPRTNPLPEDPSMGMTRYIEEQGLNTVALVYPDRRGSGYGLSRYRDSGVLDFTRIENEPDTIFAHKRGFVAKTSATDPGRLRELLAIAHVRGASES